ncbi:MULTISPECIES: hypothetical protein [unclassified Mesorhizobium]|uniref:hypothetical protein n=1 Tax=unclassified Mesorhizobium TaxID=325217 RepID=UPI00112C5DF6|nr:MULTISPECIES: hypothetical protein [unclassified Mesorhizobium]MCA0025478.1 hypothetical protein [Mesorhizobium sp. B263B1A]TPJ97134.1 hypothetical protein FJ489_11895 [Mesorhizobium sp. B2-5-12]TPK27199.1 hypothetical protein FJ562_08130 [Mesorhizobium sp. B2-5-6]
MRRFKVPVTTDGSGNATVTSPRLAGKIHSIIYVKDATNAYTDGVDFTMTAEDTGENVWTQANVNASVAVYPRAPVSSQAGVASLYAAGGTAIQDKIGIVDRLKIVLAQGGASKTGLFHILVD